MDIRVRGVYVVKGGAGALADAVAATFGKAGARLALLDRGAEGLSGRAARHRAMPVVADLVDAKATAAAIADVEQGLGHIDGLIHTAGAFALAPAATAPPELYDRMFDVNVRTLVNVTRAVLP